MKGEYAMSKHLLLGCACFTSVVCVGAAQAEVDVAGYLKNETSVYTRTGQVTGSAVSTLDTSDHHNAIFDVLKFENSARFFLNGDLGENATWHGDINVIADTEGVRDRYKWHRSYTQHDWLKELYIDTSYKDWYFRIGKQQVVWGTADGIKLLDIINPTDWREFNQNTFEDSRIPVWMINAERNVGDTGNIQFIISQHEESKFAGLNDNGDSGHPFIFKGVDTITGRVNGFRNIAPIFGRMAQTFHTYATSFGFPGLNTSFFGVNNTTVQDFLNGTNAGVNPNQAGSAFALGACNFDGFPAPSVNTTNGNAKCLSDIAQRTDASATYAGLVFAGNDFQTNTIDGGPIGDTSNAFFDSNNPNSTFEYVTDTTFGTFNNFVNLKSVYRRDYPDELDANLGMRYKFFTEGGTNISLNYFFGYDPNPSVTVHYETPDGTRVTPHVGDGPGGATSPSGGDLALNEISLHDSTGAQRCDAAGGGGLDIDAATPGGTGCNLVFEETVHRVHNIGASFDTSIDKLSVPVVVRGEFLYQKDVRVPVIDRGELAIGNITEALKSEETDMFKYVIGVDFNIFTNLFVSAQFIQFINLDFIDEESARTSAINTRRAASNIPAGDFRRYTGHLPTLHLDNGLNAGEEYENFISFFLSKPFGPSQEHRWNNIIIREERGGWWNRFDVEYTFSDKLLGTFEWNHYWGDENSMFGQFDKSSNLQAGVKYIF